MTIISHTHQFFFVHLHKCGGSSVETAYQPHATWRDLVIGSTPEGEKLQPIMRKLHNLHKHNTAQELQQLTGPYWDEYWTVAIVRHPISIYESFYRWIAKLIDGFCERNEMSKAELRQRIERGEIQKPFVNYNATSNYLAGDGFYEFIEESLKKRNLPGTLTNRLYRDDRLLVDSVFRIEEFDMFWEAFSERVGMDVEPLHENRGVEKEDVSWTREQLDRVNEIYAVDYRNFGYEPA